MNARAALLVCFAVKEEARFFKPSPAATDAIEVLVTGMGKTNARTTFLRSLENFQPQAVLTCGFAGGLNPEFDSGQVVFWVDPGAPSAWEAKLVAAGARAATFHCADRVAITAREKQQLRASTQADAVEMESGTIAALCRERQIPCAIVRVILDTAREDLPLDFNRLMGPDQTMDFGKLTLALLRAPGRVPALLRLQQQTGHAAKRLAAVLATLTVK